MPLGTLRPPPTFFVADADHDGRVTGADALAWLEQAFFLPGDWALWSIARYAPSLASAFGIKTPEYGGFLAGTISTVVWLLAIILIGTLYSYVVAFNRRATRGMHRLQADALRLLRAAGVWLRARLGFGKKDVRKVAEPAAEIPALEVRVLCELAALEAGYVASPLEVARALSLPAEETRDVLDAMQRGGLVVRTLGGSDGESGYVLSKRGRGVLLQRIAAPS